MNPCVTSITQASLNVDLDVWSWSKTQWLGQIERTYKKDPCNLANFTTNKSFSGTNLLVHGQINHTDSVQLKLG